MFTLHCFFFLSLFEEGKEFKENGTKLALIFQLCGTNTKGDTLKPIKMTIHVALFMFIFRNMNMHESSSE